LSQGLAMREGCGLLADGQACQSINHSGIRRDRAHLSGVAGLLVVSIEGRDLLSL
jgi:hypothetical protein